MIRVYFLLLLAGIAYGGYMYYMDTQNRIAQLQANNAKLQVAAETNQKTIESLREEADAFEERNAELQIQLQAAESYQDELIGKLRRHNLTVLTLQKPGLIEKRVNDATQKLLKEMEADSSRAPAPVPNTN